MTGWNEDNFLERLMSQPPRNPGGKQNSCPDAETLCAVAEAGGGGPQGEALARHVMRCPSCAELYSRLLNFERGSLLGDARSWNETEHRLERWLATFLSSAAAGSRPVEPAGAVPAPLPWQAKRRPAVLRLQWALPVAAVLALAVTGAFLARRKSAPPHPQNSARAVLPAEQSGSAPVAARPAQAGSSEQEAAKVPMPGRKHNSASVQRSVPSKMPDSGVQAETEQAANEPPATSPSTAPPAASAPEPAEIAQAAPPAPVQTGTPSSPPGQPQVQPPLAGGQRAAAESTPPAPKPVAGMFGKLPVLIPGTRQPSRAASAAGSGAVANHSASVRFASGTRVWIRLNSVSRQPDGSFTFKGSLHLPVQEANGLLLDRGTEINGSGTVNQAGTSLLVTEFVVEGAHFTLKSAAGQAQGPAQVASPAPPAQPQTEPPTIQSGQTPEQVQAVLGDPEKKVDLGSKMIYVYKSLKVTFVNGKVSDVGAFSAQTPGAGRAVRFDAGRVLEMWFNSDSVYEEAPDAGR
jgi:hypothetical protein